MVLLLLLLSRRQCSSCGRGSCWIVCHHPKVSPSRHTKSAHCCRCGRLSLVAAQLERVSPCNYRALPTGLLLLLLLLLLLVAEQHVPDVVGRGGRIGAGYHDALSDAFVGYVLYACHALLQRGGGVLLHTMAMLLLLLLLRWYTVHLDVGRTHRMATLTTDAGASVGVACQDSYSTSFTLLLLLLLLVGGYVCMYVCM